MSSGSPQFLLYTCESPNGHKVSIFLEELKDAYGLDYEFRIVDMLKGEQKEDNFLKLNPNGRIPVLVDHASPATEGKEFTLFESGAIMLYLSQHYDVEHRFSFSNPAYQAEAIQWIFFTHGGIGLMQGQAHHFVRYAVDRIPYAMNRYLEETKRLYGVLETRLTEREYLAGPGKGVYSIADINCFPWVRMWPLAGIDSIEPFPNLKAWLDKCQARPAAQRGLDIPSHSEILDHMHDPKFFADFIHRNRTWQGLIARQ